MFESQPATATAQPATATVELFKLPPDPLEILPVTQAMVSEYMSLFVNRRAFARQSDKPGANGKHPTTAQRSASTIFGLTTKPARSAAQDVQIAIA